MFWLLFGISTAFCEACGLYDEIMTSRGLAKHLAVEGNTFLVGSNPTISALIGRDALLLSFAIAPALVAHFVHNVGIEYGALSGPIGYGIKHIIGGIEWKKLGA